MQPCGNYLLTWACGHLERWLTLTDGSEGCQLFLYHHSDFCSFRTSSVYTSSMCLTAALFLSSPALFFWCFSWDESSSISSGLSDGDGDGSENLSSEEFNASSSLNSLPSTPLGSRRNSSAMVSWKKSVPNSLWQLYGPLFFFFLNEWLGSQPTPLLATFAACHSVISATKTHHRPQFSH